MKIALPIIVTLLGLVLVLMKYDFIVFDRLVFEFQISHILKRGKINSLREYDAILNAVEERFEEDNVGFANDPKVEVMNAMLAEYHAAADQAPPQE